MISPGRSARGKYRVFLELAEAKTDHHARSLQRNQRLFSVSRLLCFQKKGRISVHRIDSNHSVDVDVCAELIVKRQSKGWQSTSAVASDCYFLQIRGYSAWKTLE
eukprot:TRINITY_DN7133_c0_g1_i2.p2 TRINITY_DN7133_c0_g1~~TRINITY_DN7133_c0_g1_i2.p2  ORF type:complete len:105 (+),score=3.38 TRINITY_DN7133_c0_g1_i2:382-696(+)